jgi:hypothetical protein
LLGEWLNLDLAGCHPSIILNISELLGIKVDYLQDYVRDRSQMAQFFGINEIDLKLGVNSFLYGGNPFRKGKPFSSYSLEIKDKLKSTLLDELSVVKSKILEYISNKEPTIKKDLIEWVKKSNKNKDLDLI